MRHSRILTLLTDFGLSDAYVGVLKGTIAQINPHLTVIDLTHEIPPQNIALARFALMSAFPYFPPETVHVAVVDPGVGSQRRAIAIALGTDPAQPIGFLVGPDNGLFSGVLSQMPVLEAVALTHAAYWRTPEPSRTFHGRDIFAPVGAHLASGVALANLGIPIALESLTQFDLPTCRATRLDDRTTRVTGCIQAIDHFGNLITNIPATEVCGKAWHVLVNNLLLPGQLTYSDNAIGQLVALVGSHGWVEIAVNGGSAQIRLNWEFGQMVRVVVRDEE
jgi:S-adenosylmethionine hydrolase